MCRVLVLLVCRGCCGGLAWQRSECVLNLRDVPHRTLDADVALAERRVHGVVANPPAPVAVCILNELNRDIAAGDCLYYVHRSTAFRAGCGWWLRWAVS